MKYLKDITDWKECVNEIVCGDCLEGMKLIPDKSVDLVLTDPPYEIVAGGSGGCFGVEKRDYHKGVKTLSDGFSNEILDEAKRVCKVMNCYVFCNKNQVLQILNWSKRNNFNIDILCYHKTNPIPTTNNKYLSDTEYIIFIREGGTFLGGTYETKKKYFIQENAKNDFDHPTVKPINIISTLIQNSSIKDNLVLDCFMGSWTTARACKDLGRNFIGFEISEKYCQIGTERLRQEVLF